MPQRIASPYHWRCFNRHYQIVCKLWRCTIHMFWRRTRVRLECCSAVACCMHCWWRVVVYRLQNADIFPGAAIFLALASSERCETAEAVSAALLNAALRWNLGKHKQESATSVKVCDARGGFRKGLSQLPLPLVGASVDFDNKVFYMLSQYRYESCSYIGLTPIFRIHH